MTRPPRREEIDFENQRFKNQRWARYILSSQRPWTSTGLASEPWECIRQRMNPRPRPAEFIRLCDQYLDAAMLLSPSWNGQMLNEYILGCLLRRK
jgi:hypothetical protein